MKKCNFLCQMLLTNEAKLRSYAFMIDHRRFPTAFTRLTKLSFYRVMAITIGFMKKSTQHEVNRFFNTIGGNESVTRQALQKAREKISYTAYEELFEDSVKLGLSAEDGNLFNGYRLLAVDGSTLMLENTEELRRKYGSTSPVKNDCYARMSMISDLLNDLVVDARLEPYSIGERALAIQQVRKLRERQTGTYLLLMDRGYWKRELFDEIIETGNRFLIRVSANVSKELSKKKKNSGYFDISVDGKTYSLRFARFLLNTGETETLVTNLTPSELSDDGLFKLYSLRWGVETKYNELKNLLRIEDFTGKSELIALQDFYSTVLLSNMVTFAAYQASYEIGLKPQSKKRKYVYKPNRNMLISALYEHMIPAVAAPTMIERSYHLSCIRRDIVRNPIPVRPDRSYPRKDNTYAHRCRKKKSVL